MFISLKPKVDEKGIPIEVVPNIVISKEGWYHSLDSYVPKEGEVLIHYVPTEAQIEQIQGQF